MTKVIPGMSGVLNIRESDVAINRLNNKNYTSLSLDIKYFMIQHSFMIKNFFKLTVNNILNGKKQVADMYHH